MVDREALIEEIELFEKLDIKYLLEELEKSSSVQCSNPSQEPIVLDEEMVELISQSLIMLIEEDEAFAQAVEEALIKVDKRNKVADITIVGVAIGSGVTLLICLLKKRDSGGGNVYGAMQNDGEIDYHLHIDDMDREEFKEILKECINES